MEKRRFSLRASILVSVLLMGFVGAAEASGCEIPGRIKKSGSKTVYFSNGEKLSLRQLEKTGCRLKLSLMSASDLRSLKIVDLKKKLAKLGVK